MAKANGNSGSPNVTLAASLLGGLGLLTALLSALATANGGIGRIELNERTLLFFGSVGIFAALVAGAIALTGINRTQAPAAARPATRSLLARTINPALIGGALLLAGGLIAVTYAAVTHVAGRPGITASLRWDNNLGVMVDGNITVNDIPSTEHLEMRVDAIKGDQAIGTPIYASSFGPNSAGDVTHTFEVPVPNNTNELLIQAWTGQAGSCFDAEIPEKTSRAEIKNNLGCLRLRLPPYLTTGAATHSARQKRGRSRKGKAWRPTR